MGEKMSFANDIKNEIMNSQQKKNCCKRAFINGIIAAKATTDNGEIFINVSNDEYAVFLKEQIREIFSKEAMISAPPKGGRCKTISFTSPSAEKFLQSIDTEASRGFKCPNCESSFFRGIFWSCGRISDPQKQFCLEFSLVNRENVLTTLFSESGIELKNAKRGKETLLYTKNSSIIEDFFALINLQNVTFKVIDIKIANELKNRANRLRNFDTVNISKAVDAANAQYNLIKELDDKKLLSSLPDELISTARMRLENPEMSLSQLAIHSVPPISKSGITHRMNKIVKLGESLLKKI